MSTQLKQTREYVDLDFSFEKHPITENLAIKKKVNAVKQSIIHLLTLKKSDKPFHPEIHSPIYIYLFENATNIVKVVLEDEVFRYISALEPRVKLAYVNVSYPNPNGINCEVVGKIINISEPFTVNVLINRLR